MILVIALEAGTGHKATWTEKSAEIEDAVQGESGKASAAERKKEEIKNPGVLNIAAGIVLIFASFVALSGILNKRRRIDRS